MSLFAVEETTRPEESVTDVASDLPQDVSPVPEYACQTCGTALTYSGRGRKPKYCAEHRKGSSTSTGRAKTVGKNAASAGQAAEVLVQINTLIAVTVGSVGFPLTGGQLLRSQEVFREQAYNALCTDPALCATILRMGARSAKASLVMAYGTMAMSCAPHAIQEMRDRQAAREDE